MTTKAKSTTTAATESIETVLGAGSDAVKQSFDRAVKGYDNVASFNKETLDALIQAANAAGKGLEALNSEALAYSKQSIEETIAATKAAMGSRSIQELMEVNTDFAKASFDSFVSEMTKLSDLFVNAAKGAAEPLNGRTAALVQMVQGARLS